MPNLEQSKAKLAEYKNAKIELKAGKCLILDGVELSPSMGENDTESDLTSVSRMIARLEQQVRGAESQRLRKGIEVEGADGTKLIGFAVGVPGIATDLGLTGADLKKVVPTGSQGKISKRDIRVFARAKASGTINEYVEKAEAKRTGKNVTISKPKPPATDEAPKPEAPKPPKKGRGRPRKDSPKNINPLAK